MRRDRGSLHAHVLIDARQIRVDEELRVEVQPYRGFAMLSAHVWYRGPTGSWLPGKNGLTVRIGQLPWLARALATAEHEALEAALLDQEAYESAGLELPHSLTDDTNAPDAPRASTP